MQYTHLRDIADEIPPLDSKAQVQLLVGRNAPELLKVRAFRNGPKGTPWAYKLAVGWTICGQACVDRQGGAIHVGTHHTIYYNPPRQTHIEQGDVDNSRCDAKPGQNRSNPGGEILYHELTPCKNTYIVQENFPDVYQTTDRDNETTMSIEDRRFTQTMESKTHKNETGHWEMPLPLRASVIHLPDNRDQASSRLKGLLHSFKRNPKVEQDYFDFMGKLFKSGHAVPIPIEVTSHQRRLGKFGTYHILVFITLISQIKSEWYSIPQQSSKEHPLTRYSCPVRICTTVFWEYWLGSERNAIGVMCDIQGVSKKMSQMENCLNIGYSAKFGIFFASKDK